MILVGIILLLYLVINSTNLGYHEIRDIDCIETDLGDEEINDNILFSYENDNGEILLYNSPQKGFYKYHLKKEKILGTVKYREKYSDNILPNTAYKNEFKEVDKYLSYTFVNCEDDIESIDFGGYNPIYSKFEYFDKHGNKVFCYICILDKTQNGRITRGG